MAALSLAGALSALPLIAGLCLRVRDAVATTLFGVASAFALTYCGIGPFTGGGLFVGGSFAGGTIAVLAGQLLDPSVWVIALSWLAAAALGALLCSRGGRPMAAAGMAAASGILIFGLMARAFFESGLVSWMPEPADVAVAAVAGLAAAAIAAWLGAPARPGSRARRSDACRARTEAHVPDSRAFDAAPDSTDVMSMPFYDDDPRFR